MRRFFKITTKFSSFRSQLLGLVLVGIFGLALAVSLITSWVTSNKVAGQMVAQGLQIADTLAEQSILALIYSSPQNAEAPLNTILSFPNVVYAAILQVNMHPLATIGDEQWKDFILAEGDKYEETLLVHETDKTWHFMAPVSSRMFSEKMEDNYQFFTEASDSEQLGYAYVIVDKSALKTLQNSILRNNILIALFFALILVFVVNLGIKRLTSPLYNLMQVMKRNEDEGSKVRADLKGPTEINNLAQRFNTMMGSLEERDKRLRNYGKKLEAEVTIRTRELVEARDAALSANRHKSEFLANISHELRTPLQAIIGYSELVREELDLIGETDQVEHLDLVINNSNRLLRLINDILNLAKVESGKMDLKLETTDLRELLTEATNTVKPLMHYNNNRLETRFLGSDIRLVIDRDKLLHIVLNLLSNAAKFTNHGLVTLISNVSSKQLSVKVQDNGIGLAKDQQKIIFEKFRQVDGSTTRNYEGTGLGLAISQGFCELMGGTISVESEPGEGATFHVIIPLPIGGKREEKIQTFSSGTQTRRIISTY